MSDAIARAIARYAVADFPSVEDRVLHEARRRLLDSLGVGLAALGHPGPVAARAYARCFGTAAGSLVWGTDLRVPAEIAALVNGVAVRCLDFNDSYFSRDSTHPSDMVAGLLAVAESRGRTGRDLLEAIAVGYEVAVAACDAFGVRERGWDQTNITALGACAGAGRLLGLDRQRMEHAVAMTVVPRAGMLQARYGNVAMWKGFGGPDAARAAVAACLLADAGVSGPNEPFEGPKGFVALLLGGDVPDSAPLERLAGCEPPTRILDTHVKRWPVGYVAQAAVEAAHRVHGELEPGEEIAAVEIATFRMALDVMASPEKWAPASRETADHSLPYVVAAMLRDGDIGEAAFALARVRAAETHAFLRDRVTVVEDPVLTARYPASFPARVSVRTDRGRALHAQVDDPPGSARNPMTDDVLEAKFHAACGPVLGSRAAEVATAVRRLADGLPLDGLTRLLGTAAAPGARGDQPAMDAEER